MSVVRLPETVTVAAEQIRQTAAQIGVQVPERDLDAYRVFLSGLDSCIDQIEAEDDYLPLLDAERFPRSNVHRPSPEDNAKQFNSWAYKVHIASTNTEDKAGPLAGFTVAIKDNVNIATVPSLLGTDVFEDPYIPEYDATIVTRILRAGGTIVGKAACENFSLSPNSFTNAQAKVMNPLAPGYSAGGSSSGSAALLAGPSPIVNMAIGGDQGGSIRLPASYCGIVGLKPTYGLVPYTGIAPLSSIVDHTGPMTTNVLDNARLLSAIAGKDGLDDRQMGAPEFGLDYYTPLLAYANDPKAAVKGMRIGVLVESLEVPGLDPRVREKVRVAAELFRSLGAEVVDVSIPMHTLGPALWTIANRQGISEQALRGQNPVRLGVHDVKLTQKLAHWNTEMFEKAQLHNPAITVSLLGGQFVKYAYPGAADKAINLSRKLRDTYEAVIKDHHLDVILLPCTPTIANYTFDLSDSVGDKMGKAVGITLNTCPLNVSGHPAISIPIGTLPVIEPGREVDTGIRLPVGMQIMAGFWQENRIYRTALAFEKSFDWRIL
ncbi:Amidase signature enzyme [Mycena indigotica]|uniref:Amidase signature enzyme n=1 Tax=Mycena indigotica TaxID=2126181 RepID=A0A8H6SVP7_9AGAR|nr:Amidase signature enzyme [Mycena indigotica]KAF7306336.1 Amidase signature enzyme [Mycena indigotica]